MAFVHLLPTKVSLTLLQAIHHTTVYFLAMHLLPRCTSTADTPHPFSNATPHCASSHCIVQCNFAPKMYTLHPPPAMHLSRNRWDAHLSVCNKHQWSKGGRKTNLK